MTDTLMDRLTNEIPLPAEWQLTKLRDVVLEHKSGIYKKRELFGTGHNIVGVSDLYENIGIDGQTFNLVPLTEEELDEFTLKEGDLIYGESSLVKEGIARTLYVSKNGEGTVFAWHTRKFKVESSRVNSKFLNYLLNSWPIRRKIVSVSTQTALTGITTKEFFDVKIPLPPLPEQRKIAEILSTVDETTEKADAIIQETQQLKKGLMQKLFTEGIGHTRFKETKIGRIPEEWEVVRFNQCLQETKQKDPTKKPDEKFTYIDVSAVSNEFFKIVESKTILGKDAPSRARKGIKTGDTIYATVRPYLRRVAFVPSELDGEICSTGYCVLRPKSEEIFHRFVFQLMLTHRVNEYLGSLQAGTSYPAISDSDVYQMLIPKPPLPEQRRIAEILSEVDAKIETEQAFKSELEKLKKGLMQVLLTGKVRVKV